METKNIQLGKPYNNYINKNTACTCGGFYETIYTDYPGSEFCKCSICGNEFDPYEHNF